jgi:hypothetical protein
MIANGRAVCELSATGSGRGSRGTTVAGGAAPARRRGARHRARCWLRARCPVQGAVPGFRTGHGGTCTHGLLRLVPIPRASGQARRHSPAPRSHAQNSCRRGRSLGRKAGKAAVQGIPIEYVGLKSPGVVVPPTSLEARAGRPRSSGGAAAELGRGGRGRAGRRRPGGAERPERRLLVGCRQRRRRRAPARGRPAPPPHRPGLRGGGLRRPWPGFAVVEGHRGVVWALEVD